MTQETIIESTEMNKTNQTVLELYLWAVNFFSSLDGIWTHTIDTLQHQSFSLMSSALSHSTTSAIYIYCWICSRPKNSWNTARWARSINQSINRYSGVELQNWRLSNKILTLCGLISRHIYKEWQYERPTRATTYACRGKSIEFLVETKI
jgi:hypothetical protein